MGIYNIADEQIEILNQKSRINKNLEYFAAKSKKQNMLKVLFREELHDNMVENVVDQDVYGILFKILEGDWRYLIRKKESIYKNSMLVNRDWSECIITDANFNKEDEYSKIAHFELVGDLVRGYVATDEWMELLMVSFYSALARKKALLIHASAIIYKGKAIVFTASSGVGKTTQAELWSHYTDSKIVNGDKVFLRLNEKKQVVAYGSPWIGSSPYISKLTAPVQAVIVLSQGIENDFIRLDTQQSLSAILENSFLPTWDEECIDGTMKLINDMIGTIPIYSFKCRKDKSAVEQVKSTLF